MVRADANVALIPHWRGEYLATRALALACCEQKDEALDFAEQAALETTLLDVSVFVAATRSIVSLQTDATAPLDLCRLAAKFNIWDPVVCAARSWPGLADALSSDPQSRGHVETLYARSGDLALARRAGSGPEQRGHRRNSSRRASSKYSDSLREVSATARSPRLSTSRNRRRRFTYVTS